MGLSQSRDPPASQKYIDPIICVNAGGIDCSLMTITYSIHKRQFIVSNTLYYNAGEPRKSLCEFKQDITHEVIWDYIADTLSLYQNDHETLCIWCTFKDSNIEKMFTYKSHDDLKEYLMQHIKMMPNISAMSII